MGWLGAHIRKVLGFLVSTGLLTVWATGSVEPLVPSPARAWLALVNTLQETPSRSEDRFRIVLCWLKGDDNGKDTETVEEAFLGVNGIELMRSARVVAAKGAADDWRPAIQKRARTVMEDWEADLAIAGLVKRSGEALTLWFVPYSSDEGLDKGTLNRGDKPYQLEAVTLADEFHEDLRAELTATALSSVAPFVNNEARGQVLQEGLQNVTEKLSKLLTGDTITRDERRSDLQAALGDALLAWGEREVGTGRLEGAVAAFRLALKGRPQAGVPIKWARTQSKLGNALTVLGERKGDTALLEEAVVAFRLALEGQIGTKNAASRAKTQNNLGNALQAWGKLESGSARLEEAVRAYRLALEELSRTRLDTPLEWASTQNNLGTALAALGDRRREAELLEEAITVFQLALEERIRERVPLSWARTQSNLGIAHAILGTGEGRTERLEEALVTFRLALEVFALEEAPMDWARSQINLGNTLAVLGDVEKDTARMVEALEAYRLVIEEISRADAPLIWALAQTNLGNALATLGERTSGTEHFQQAMVAYAFALEVYRDKKVFPHVFTVQAKLWRLYLSWNARRNNL